MMEAASKYSRVFFKRKAAFESDWAEVSRYPHDEEIYVHIRKALLI